MVSKRNRLDWRSERNRPNRQGGLALQPKRFELRTLVRIASSMGVLLPPVLAIVLTVDEDLKIGAEL